MERKQYDYLIIGGDAAGLSAVGQIRRMHKEASIGVLERGEIISYGACGLPYAIGGQIDDFNKLIHFTPEAFADRNHCDVFTATEVIAVDFENLSVMARTAQGETQFRYGKLIIGTGAEAVRPALIPASDRFLVLKSVPDGRAIAERIKAVGARNVLILGAGYIGLEMADVLHSMGLRIEIVDMADRPVPRMPVAISKAVSRKLDEKQIPLYVGEAIQSARDTGSGIQCATSNRTLDADLAIVAIGVRPATGFLDESKIKLAKGAIDINAYGETSVPDVYAGGDCAMVYHRLLRKNVYMPLGSTANKQGRIAGMNAAGERIAFPGIIGTQIFKFFELALGATGLSESQAREAGYDPVTVKALRPSRAGYYPGGSNFEVHLTIDRRSSVILGGFLVGPPEQAAALDTIGVMAQQGMTARDAAWFDAAYAPPFAPVWNALISAAGKFNGD